MPDFPTELILALMPLLALHWVVSAGTWLLYILKYLVIVIIKLTLLGTPFKKTVGNVVSVLRP